MNYNFSLFSSFSGLSFYWSSMLLAHSISEESLSAHMTHTYAHTYACVHALPRRRERPKGGEERENEKRKRERERNAVGSEFLENIIIIGNNTRIPIRFSQNAVAYISSSVHQPFCIRVWRIIIDHVKIKTWLFVIPIEGKKWNRNINLQHYRYIQCFPLYNFQRTFNIHTFNHNIIFKIFYVCRKKYTFDIIINVVLYFCIIQVTILNILFEHLRNYVFFFSSSVFYVTVEMILGELNAYRACRRVGAGNKLANVCVCVSRE